jgi:WD40 repeat protein
VWDVASRGKSGLPLAQQPPNPVRSLAFSPDDRLLAAGSENKTVVVWSLAAGSEPRILTGHTNWVTSVAFSPDGRTLATGSNDRTINLWDVATFRPLTEPLIGHTDNVRGVVFSPRPEREVLASAGEDGNVFLWDLEVRRTLVGTAGPISAVAFARDGHTLAAAANEVVLWDPSTRLVTSRLAGGHKSGVAAVAFSPTDGRWLASGGFDTRVILWDTSTGHPIGNPLATHTAELRQVAFSPDGARVASVSRDGQLFITDVASRTQLGPVKIGNSWVWSMAWSPNGAKLAFGLEDASIVLWDVAQAAPAGPPLKAQNEAEWTLAFSPDGSALASGSNDNSVVLWDLTAQPPRARKLGSHKDDVEVVAFSPDGRLLASAGLDRTVLLWDARTGERVAPPLTDHTDSIWGLAFSPDSRTLASGSADQTVKLWQTAAVMFNSFADGRDRACRTANRNPTLQEWTDYVGGQYQRTCAEFGPGDGAPADSPAAQFR